MALACKAVGGEPEQTENTALSLSLMNLSFYIWDDIIDKASYKKLKPTLYGEYGQDTSIIIGGLAAAKAFTILSQNQLDTKKQQIVNNMIWRLWVKMARAETSNLKQRKTKSLTSRGALWKMKTEAGDLKSCLEIGAIIGRASCVDIKHLGKYGQNLALIHELWKDFLVTANITLELKQKIQTDAFPYALLLAKESSKEVEKVLYGVTSEELDNQVDVREIVKSVLETGALENILSLIEQYSDFGKKELEGLKITEASQTLKEYLAAQTRLFRESLRSFTG
jgi:geranylgeranyl pyrophosphate synthase